MIWSPSTTSPVGVDGQAAVGVAVEGHAERPRRARRTASRQPVEVGRAVAVVDVQAVRPAPIATTSAPARRQRLRRDLVGRAVGAVDDDGQPVEPVRQRRQQVRRRSGRRRRAVLADPADGGAGGPLPVLAEPPLDGVLDLVGQLVAAAGEELDARCRASGCGLAEIIDAEVGAEIGGEERDGRGRQHADVEHVDPGARQARRRRRPPGTPRTPAGHGPTTAVGRCPSTARRRRRGRGRAATDRSRASSAVRSPVSPGPSYPVGAEDRPSADARVPISACCTAEPCGPS